MTYPDPNDPRNRRYDGGTDPTRAYTQATPPASGEPYSSGYTDAYGTYGAPAPQQPAPQKKKSPVEPQVNPVLFSGGVVMTGVVTGLAAWLVAWIIGAIVDRVNATGKFSAGNPIINDPWWFAIAGFLCALFAGALWYVLHLITPAPGSFYRWIVLLLIAAAVIVPLIVYTDIAAGISSAVLHLIIGLPILTLIPTMARQSTKQ